MNIELEGKNGVHDRARNSFTPSPHGSLHDPIPDINMPGDYDDLLCGLDGGDLDDFDGLDDDQTEPEREDDVVARRSVPLLTGGISPEQNGTCPGQASMYLLTLSRQCTRSLHEQHTWPDRPSTGSRIRYGSREGDRSSF